jgi:hypothetical protein
LERTSKPAAAILGIVGGAVLIVGSLLTWVTLSFDPQRFAQSIADAVGVDVSQLGTIPAVPSSEEVGTAVEGKYTLIAGVVVLVCAILLLVNANVRSFAPKLMILGGVVGVGLPLYDVLTTDRQLDNAIAGVEGLASGLKALGLSTDVFKDAVNVEWGIGVWVCVVGGVIALVGGIMAARSSGPPVGAPAVGSGWGGDDVVGMPPPSVVTPTQVTSVPSETAPPITPAPPETPPAPIPPPAPEEPGPPLP